MRRRFLASSTDDEKSEESSTMTSSAPRRVPLLPEEYGDERMDEQGKEERDERPRLSRASYRAASPPSFRRSFLLLLPLLLQLLQPAAACPDGCECKDGGKYVKCEPGTFTYFPYVLPPPVTHLDLSGSKLIFPDGESLRDYIPNVHTLIMRNCSLSSLPGGFVNEMSGLRRIDLAENDIREVDGEAFSGVPALEHLDLSSNRRLSLPLRAFDRLETLRSLDLSDCGIKELEQGIFHGLEHLEELKLQKNRLSMLPRGLFSQQRRLRELDLGDNMLDTTAALAPLPHLHLLNLAGNTIKYMDRLDHLALLERLDISHNHVLSLPSPPSFPSSLQWLDLSHNELRHLQTAAFDSLADLKHLNISNNKHLKDVQINVFVSLSSLEFLSLAHCSALGTFGPAAFQPLPSSLRSLHLGGIGGLKCDDCKLRSFPDTVELRGRCIDETGEHVPLSSLGSCDSLLSQSALLVLLAAVVVALVLILVLLMVCCRSGRKESRPVTPIKHANYTYGGGHRKMKGKHSSLSPPLLASSSSSSTSPSGRDFGVYEARLGAGPLGGGIIYGAGGYLDWEGPATMMQYGVGGGGEGSSSGNSSGRSDYSEIPAYTQNRYCVPKSTVARAFAAPPLVPGAPRLPQTPPPSMHPQGMFPALPSGTLYPPPKYSPPPPPSGYPETPLALQQQLHHQSIPPPCAYSPLTRL
ncbi:hypothetical protein PMAYCL1PPCAC_25883 [Pristionchus mayeri]|uniref:Uncharacterized protein n=1 Tax=Pristionchus mayeri TaxID=1317129 RepID=A0AAN5D355_9BILA|nr:hypothetical protein PMAYCL1PPCAC_25883 [Pristionchus mayeri]